MAELRASPEAALAVVEDMCSSFRYLQGRLCGGLSYRSVPQRTAALLLRLVDEWGRVGPGGRITLELSITRTEMAEFLRAPRESVSRALSALVKRGIISLDTNHLTIFEPDFLRRRSGAYNYPYPNPGIQDSGVPSTRSGTTVTAVVRAASMRPVRELQESPWLPFYVLWDDRGMVSERYGVGEAEVAAVLVETDGKIAWRSEQREMPPAEQILREIRAVLETAGSAEAEETPAPEPATRGRTE